MRVDLSPSLGNGMDDRGKARELSLRDHGSQISRTWGSHHHYWRFHHHYWRFLGCLQDYWVLRAPCVVLANLHEMAGWRHQR